jgi:selenocysteine lyase/cysteine desulfurase
MLSRRRFMRSVAGAAGLGAAAAFRKDGIGRVFALASEVDGIPPEKIAADEDFWREAQQAFTVDRALINLNNGGVSPSPRVVQDAMRRYLEFSNQAPTINMWQVLEPEIESVRRRLAVHFGCDADEIAITRNASESLETCILGLDLKPGDEVITTTQDYPRMINAWLQRERREGIKFRTIPFQLPPPSIDHLYEIFEQAITPRTRVILVSHITFTSGQIFPVKRICRLGRERGIEVIVDGAHAFAHFPFKHADLDCDYYGSSLHKWLFAPHGTGLLFVRRSKIKGLWPMMAAEKKQDDDIRKFEEIGTHPAANHNAIAEALSFHEGIGIERKAARLRYLKNRWARRLSERKRVSILTPFDPQQSCALATFSIDGIPPYKLVEHLWTRYRIIVTPIDYNGCVGIRVTPSVYTTLREIDTFCEAVEGVIDKGLPT